MLKEFIDSQGWQCRTFDWPDRYYFGRQKGGKTLVDAETADENDPDVVEVHRLFDELPGVPTDRDVTALEWLRDIVKASDRVIALAESIYANDFGCSLSMMGMHESIVEKKKWVYGEKYLVLDRSLRAVAEALGEGLDVRLDWKVKEIHYGRGEGGGARGGGGGGEGGEKGSIVSVIGGQSGDETIEARRCIVATPITALKSGGSIAFNPPLPSMKTDAIGSVQMSNAVKVFLAFDAPFWPAGLFDVVCADCFLPELWILSYPPEQKNDDKNKTTNNAPSFDPSVARRTKEVVTFFAAGNLADHISSTMSKQDIVDKALDQLDEMFGTESDPKPSRARLTGSHVADWSKEQLVGGAYTYPSLRSSGYRGVLAAPVGDELFFAGEATHVGVNPCMQGAMETGMRAACQVLACVKGPPRSRM